jgi:hypothetical protein
MHQPLLYLPQLLSLLLQLQLDLPLLPQPPLKLVLPLHYLMPAYLPQLLQQQQLLPLAGQQQLDLNNLVDLVDMQLRPDKLLQLLVLAVFAQR